MLLAYLCICYKNKGSALRISGLRYKNRSLRLRAHCGAASCGCGFKTDAAKIGNNFLRALRLKSRKFCHTYISFRSGKSTSMDYETRLRNRIYLIWTARKQKRKQYWDHPLTAMRHMKGFFCMRYNVRRVIRWSARRQYPLVVARALLTAARSSFLPQCVGFYIKS